IRASDLNMVELARHTVCIVEHTIGADRLPFPFSEDKLTTFQRLYRNGSVGCLDKGTGDEADGVIAFFICFELALSSWSFGFIGPGLRIFLVFGLFVSGFFVSGFFVSRSGPLAPAVRRNEPQAQADHIRHRPIAGKDFLRAVQRAGLHSENTSS